MQSSPPAIADPDWSSIRLTVLERDQRRCVACDEPCAGPDAHVHHLIPRSAGGTDDPGNLITLCASCHAAHHPNLQVGLARRSIVRWATKLARLLDRAHELGDADESLEIVLRLLGVERLRPAQLDVILAALQGESVLFVSATGSGKTLCFQVPVLLRDGCAFVISPLKALMREQIADIQRKKIPGTFINSDLSPTEKKERYELLRQRAFRFFLCTPERFDPDIVRASELSMLSGTRPRWLVVDEAHCVDRWGSDFRPNYGRLGEVRERLGKPQVLAFTATAGKESQKRILASLGVPEARVILTGVDRPNIALARISMDQLNERRFELIRDLMQLVGKGRTMVFVPSRRIGFAVQAGLMALGVDLPFYHSTHGTANDRDNLLGRFTGRIQPPLKGIICTNAFGMGLDVRDVRLVVHWQPPPSVEDYLQEFGRAGRDGKPSVALLFTADRDEGLPRYMAEKTVESTNMDATRRAELLEAKYRAIDEIVRMSTDQGKCFRAAIADYFGSGERRRPVSVGRRLLEWIFTRRARIARATGCCDRCDRVNADSILSWATAVLSGRSVARPADEEVRPW